MLQRVYDFCGHFTKLMWTMSAIVIWFKEEENGFGLSFWNIYHLNEEGKLGVC